MLLCGLRAVPLSRSGGGAETSSLFMVGVVEASGGEVLRGAAKLGSYHAKEPLNINLLLSFTLYEGNFVLVTFRSEFLPSYPKVLIRARISPPLQCGFNLAFVHHP